MMKDKRGISAVVGTILIILLVLVAVVIIYAVVEPMIRGAGESAQFKNECREAISSLSIDRARMAPTAAGSDKLQVWVRRGADNINITAIQVIYLDLTETNSEEKTAVPGQNEVGMFDILNPSTPAIPKRVKIAPKIKIKTGEEKLCDIAAEKEVEPAP